MRKTPSITEESPSSHGARVPSRLTPEPSRQDRQITDLQSFQTWLTFAIYAGVAVGSILAGLYFTDQIPAGITNKIGSVLKWMAVIPIVAVVALGIPLAIAYKFSGKSH